jgi:hypothetical protein
MSGVVMVFVKSVSAVHEVRADGAMRCVVAAVALCRELVEYKYVVLNADGTVDRWQPGDNLKMEVPVAQVRAWPASVCWGWLPAGGVVKSAIAPTAVLS